jgi:aminoglycoside 2''-phosphotransferase
VILEPDWNAIASEVPELTIRSAAPIGEGWTAIAYLVNDELVFKFPKRHSEWEELDREIAFLAYARPYLPLPVVEHLHRVRDSKGAPNGYAVYRHLPGRAVQPENLSSRARAALAETLAGFLRALHEMEPGPVASILPRDDEHAVVRQYWETAEHKIAPHLSGAERRRLSDVFARHLHDPRNFAGPSCIVHADLGVDHVLCVEQAVTGILDWGDVCLGDPDYDFGGYLYEELGEAFIREMALHYGHADPERLVRKARYFTVVGRIDTIVHGGDRALPGDEAESWQRLRVLLRNDA